jgi:membrane protease subunit (stomatin/prohibitin family)
MGVFDFVRSGVREMMVARPDNFKNLIVYKHPDQNIPMYSQLTVDSDECAVFFKDGRVVGIIPPGRVTLQSQNIPFLNALVTSFTGGQVLIAEVYFVKTTPVRSVPFGGPIGDMIDPLTGEQVQPRIFGEMSVVVVDPVKFILGYSGQAATGDNDFVLGWIKGLFMNGVKTTLGELCDSEGKSLLQAVSLTTKLAAAFVAHAPDLNDIGVRILQVGQFNINFSDEDRQRLVAANAEIAKAQREARVKQIGVAGAAAEAQARQFQLDQQFSQDTRYVKELAGSYQGYAAGQAVMGAGRGMAEHGVGGGVAGLGAQMAVGMGVGNVMSAGLAQPGPAPTFSPGGTQATCGKCGAKQPGGKFCAECGAPLVAQKKFCSGCGVELLGGAKFCANCGTPG